MAVILKNCHILKSIKKNKKMYLKTITIEQLKTMSLSDLVSICKALDNGNGDWSNVDESEYDYILETAQRLLTEYQN